MKNSKKILVVAPHLDDAQLGAGATLNLWANSGHEIWINTLSDTSNIYGQAHGEELQREHSRAIEILGIDQNRVSTEKFPTRNFHESRQEILDHLINLRNRIQPDLVLSTSRHDSHQDHFVLANEVPRAFSKVSILSFDTYWNMSIQNPSCVVEISEDNLRAKLASLLEFKTQGSKAYLNPTNVEALARMRGLPRGFELAEAFSVVQLVAPLHLETE